MNEYARGGGATYVVTVSQMSTVGQTQAHETLLGLNERSQCGETAYHKRQIYLRLGLPNYQHTLQSAQNHMPVSNVAQERP